VRPAGTSSQTIVTLSFNQSHGSPVVALMRSPPDAMALALPVAASTTHSSIASSFVFRKARREPSGENFTWEIRACGTSVTLDSTPPAIFLNVIE
jgi:hypothetical protein